MTTDPGSAGAYRRSDITGVVLAGGRGTRMGGVDKGLVVLGGKPMIAHVLAALGPQVGKLLINANRNLDAYARFGYPVFPDMVGDYFGPLAGMASGLEAATSRYVLTAPCDSPLLANDLARRLHRALVEAGAEVSVAHDGTRMHPVFTLLRRDLLGSVLAFLDAGERKIDRWFGGHKLAVADFSDRPETFLNVNRDAERSTLEAELEKHH